MPGADDVRISRDPDLELLDRVGALLKRAAAADPSPALNEAGLLALKHPERPDTRHLVALRGPEPVGYAQLAADGTGQLVVDPASRRQGVGGLLMTSLLDAARDLGLRLQVWALGDSPAAHALAARTGLVPMRTLLIMERPLADLPGPVVPTGITIAPFRVGTDEQAWLTVNARAFAHHPEQGSIDAEDLAERLHEPWFDPAGFFLARATGDPDGKVLGFHWTKQHDALGEAGLGEVYVLGVDPDAQGRGLAKALLLTGLAHLRDAGDEVVELYVEADQPGPVGLYRAYGFTDASRDVMYGGPAVGPTSPTS
ncbi:mycothiol synthase [Microlunatus antarcticus]|uniref:Mycothiol acetyltransferase n=1 Tax=Microlunatus antarcticus TaxID=53388 RepID=A0A7W5JS82_9ACTN|nr:mycothiol synthase [Microlunatus antarcticus]MBB3325411.1 mycothiol synthase [Microlunatus antarcticus]